MQGVRAELAALGPRIDNSRRAVELLDRQVAQFDALLRAGELCATADPRVVTLKR